MDIFSTFITGLFAGGITCLAVQGGLLASSIAQQEKNLESDLEKRSGSWIPVVSFLVARLAAYTVLGILLGSLGSLFQLSLTARIILQLGAVIFMIGTALNLLQIHPIFRYFVIQPPKIFTRLIKNQSRSQELFGPAILGAMTVLIPCGATQATMAYALATGSPLAGGLTMFAFILGTTPLFLLLGIFARGLSKFTDGAFNTAAAMAILLLAAFNLSGTIALTGSPYTFTNLMTKIECVISFCSPGKVAGSTTTAKPVSEATIYITQNGYETDPTNLTIKAGSKVKLNIINRGGGGCAQSLTIPKLNLQRVVPVGQSDVLEFTAPKTLGPLSFMCSMGMYQGVITVI